MPGMLDGSQKPISSYGSDQFITFLQFKVYPMWWMQFNFADLPVKLPIYLLSGFQALGIAYKVTSSLYLWMD